MNTSGWSTELKDIVSDAKSRHTYWAEVVKLKVASALRELMEARNVNGRELACRMNKSQAHVSKLLRGDKNLTIDTIVEVAHQLNGRVEVKVTPAEYLELSVPIFNAPTVAFGFSEGPTSAEPPRRFYSVGHSEAYAAADFACNDPTYNSHELSAARA